MIDDQNKRKKFKNLNKKPKGKMKKKTRVNWAFSNIKETTAIVGFWARNKQTIDKINKLIKNKYINKAWLWKTAR